MTTVRAVAIALLSVASLVAAHEEQLARLDDVFLTWSEAQVESIGKAAFRRGRVGGMFDTRLLKTERAYNYKLAATWLTPETIRATARMHQLRSRLTDDATRALVAEAEAVTGTVVIVDIDPREGSGVIPLDWEAFLGPTGAPDRLLRGTIDRNLRDVKALAGVVPRNYDYDRFWVTFPLVRGDDGTFSATDRTAEIVVQIRGREGRVEFPVPDSLR